VQPIQLHRPRRRSLLWAAAFIVLSSCSGTARTSWGPSVGVTIQDFSIRTSTPTVDAGQVEFNIFNRGPATHEFVVVRTDLPDSQLPTGADGLSVDEEALTGVGEISEVGVWTHYTLNLRLSPGRYVYFCNLDGHYLGGMTGTLVVSDDV
jgi:uncharacterized cupredoxin-like copper-binding protein